MTIYRVILHRDCEGPRRVGVTTHLHETIDEAHSLSALCGASGGAVDGVIATTMYYSYDGPIPPGMCTECWIRAYWRLR